MIDDLLPESVDPVTEALEAFSSAAEARTGGVGGLYDFIPRVSRGYQPPRHLAPLVDVLERAHREPLKIVCHAPPRHGKTETVLHTIPWYLLQNPKIVCGYATYGADLSHSKSRVARELARTAGVELSPDATGVKEWRTRAGGGLLATGVGGPFTGFGVNVLFIDDPIKNRIDAESTTKRTHLMDWWTSVARTRLEPGGSVIVFATRWHPDDLSGELIRQGWKYLRLPALSDNDEALWPERYNVEELRQIRRDVGEYTWASLFQGLPRPRGGSVFHPEVQLYTAEALADILKSPKGWRKGMGVDFAYSRRKAADHSSMVVGLGVTIERARYTYVLEVLRKQLEAPDVARAGQKLQAKHDGCSAMGYVSGMEQGVAALMGGYGFKVHTRLAQADKFTRAQPYAASWNDKRVLLPADVEPDSWVNVFLAEHLTFTGSDDKEDDQVDAGAAMHDLLASTPIDPPRATSITTADPDSVPLFG